MLTAATLNNELELFLTDLQEDSNNSQSIRLASGFSKAWIFGVPVHQMELGINEMDLKKTKQKTKQKPPNLNSMIHFQDHGKPVTLY